MPYQVISPDGIPIGLKTYKKKLLAEQALRDWVKNYEHQGFYSTIIDQQRVRLSLEELPNHCKIEKTW